MANSQSIEPMSSMMLAMQEEHSQEDTTGESKGPYNLKCPFMRMVHDTPDANYTKCPLVQTVIEFRRLQESFAKCKTDFKDPERKRMRDIHSLNYFFYDEEKPGPSFSNYKFKCYTDVPKFDPNTMQYLVYQKTKKKKFDKDCIVGFVQFLTKMPQKKASEHMSGICRVCPCDEDPELVADICKRQDMRKDGTDCHEFGRLRP